MKLSKIKMLFAAPANAVSYDIVPSVSVISAAADGTVKTAYITLKAYKDEDGTRTELSLAESSNTVAHFIQYSIDGGSWSSCIYFRISSRASDYGVNGTATASIRSGIHFRLCFGTASSYDIIKTIGVIPVVKTGTDAAVVVLTQTSIQYRADNDGVSVAQQCYSPNCYLMVNGVSCTIAKSSDIVVTSIPDVTAVVDGTANITVTIPDAMSVSGTIRVRMTGTLNGVTYTAVGNISVEPNRCGSTGPKSPWYYYDGAFDSTKEYTGDSSKAPWVSVNRTENNVTTTYGYMLVAETNLVNGVLVAPGTSAASGIWELMSSDFKWLITEAVFTAFAKLGGLVIKDNYMISQLGIDGTTNYQNFTGEDGTWKPMLLINAATGAGWLAGGNIRFNADGSGSLAAGKISWNSSGLDVQGRIHANLMYADTKEIEDSYTIDPSTEPYYCYLVKANSEVELLITLPDATTYNGLELRFYSWKSPLSRLSSVGRLYSSNGIVVNDSSTAWTTTVTKVILEANRFVTVKAMSGFWFVMDGNVEISNND